MSDTIKVVVVGPKAGFTGKLGMTNFVDGVATLPRVVKGQEMDYRTKIRVLARDYNAHVEGSDGHKAAVEKWAKEKGPVLRGGKKIGQAPKAEAKPADSKPPKGDDGKGKDGK